MIHLVIPGEPVAQGRARFARHGSTVRTYDPLKSRGYKDYIRQVATHSTKQALDGQLVMMVDVFRLVPKSWSAVKRERALAGLIKPTIRPDCSNYLKGVEDALNGIAYVDDAKIVLVIVRKRYSLTPRLEVRIWRDNDADNLTYYCERVIP